MTTKCDCYSVHIAVSLQRIEYWYSFILSKFKPSCYYTLCVSVDGGIAKGGQSYTLKIKDYFNIQSVTGVSMQLYFSLVVLLLLPFFIMKSTSYTSQYRSKLNE